MEVITEVYSKEFKPVSNYNLDSKWIYVKVRIFKMLHPTEFYPVVEGFKIVGQSVKFKTKMEQGFKSLKEAKAKAIEMIHAL